MHVHTFVHKQNVPTQIRFVLLYTHRESEFKGTSGDVEYFTACMSNSDTSLEEFSVQFKPNFNAE